ncbi:hypothetical protein [Bizionia arctica]|nr:hypothetical protein [Bizionia arctica]
MKKNTILYILLAFLIVFNGFFLFYFLGNTNDTVERGGGDPMSFVMKQLNFNALQLEEMEGVNKKHHQKMMRINDDLKELKDALFNNLSDVIIDNKTVDSIATLIGKKQKAKEIEAFSHFRSIQELCDDKQKQKFEEIIKDALRRGDSENRPPQGKGPDGHRPPPPSEQGGKMPPPKG